MSTAHHSLQRTLTRMTIGVARELEARKKQNEYAALTEREQQFKVPISGIASFRAAWAEVELAFDIEFVIATGQRQSPFTEPLITFGYELTNYIEPVAVVAHKKRWKKNDRLDVTGCTIAIGAWVPNDLTDDLTPWRGFLHVSVQGYGAPVETDFDVGDA